MIPIDGVPAFAEVNRFVEENGYQLYDMLLQYERPLDGGALAIGCLLCAPWVAPDRIDGLGFMTCT